MTGTLRNDMKKLVKKNSIEELQEFMVTHSEDIFNWKEKYLADIMKLAVDSEAKEALEVLIDNGFNPNMDYFRNPMLHTAFRERKFEIAYTLIRKGADVQRLDFLAGSPIRTLYHFNGNLITREMVSLLKDSGYNPKNRYNEYESDWSLAVRKYPYIHEIFIELFGEDLEAEIDLPAAKESGDLEALFYQLSQYLMRMGLSDKGMENQKLEDEILLLLKLGIQVGQHEMVRNLTEAFKQKNFFDSMYRDLNFVTALLDWHEGVNFVEFKEVLGAAVTKMNTDSSKHLVTLLVNHLLNYNFNDRKAQKYKNEFFVAAVNACRNNPNKSKTISLILDIMKEQQVDEERIESILNANVQPDYPRYYKELMLGLAYMYAGARFKAEYFITIASAHYKEAGLVTKVEFADFFLTIFKPEMLDSLRNR